jgi:hypothetical protein
VLTADSKNINELFRRSIKAARSEDDRKRIIRARGAFHRAQTKGDLEMVMLTLLVGHKSHS